MLDEGDSLVLFIYVVNLQSLNFSIWNDNFVTIIVWKTPSILEIQNVWNNSLKITFNPILKAKLRLMSMVKVNLSEIIFMQNK